VDEVAALLRLARTGVLLAAPAAVLVVGAGIWLAALAHLGWHTGWLRAAVVLFVLSAGLGAAGGRRPRRAREHADRLSAARRPADRELRRLLDDRASQLANLASVVAMLAVLWLMIAKP
jgi:uncharacterized membrane protein